MRTTNLYIATLLVLLGGSLTFTALAAVPEPDHTFYGHALADGQPLFAGTITAERDADGAVLASFTLPAAPTPETIYVLRLPLDSVGPPGHFARPGDNVNFFIHTDTNGDGIPETKQLSGVGVVGQRGEAQSLDLDTAFDPGTPKISIEDTDLFEGDAGSREAVFTVRVAPVSDSEIVLQYETADGTAVGTGSGGIDYQSVGPPPAELTIEAGADSATIVVPVYGDDDDTEGDESFAVNLLSVTEGDIERGQATCLVRDDDAPPRLIIADLVVKEGDVGSSTATFAVSLSRVVEQTVTVGYATVQDTATEAEDFDAASGTLIFAPGELRRTIAVTIRGDTDDTEADETFFVDLSAPVNATLDDAQARATIVDDEQFLTWLETERNGAGGVAGLDSAVGMAIGPDGQHVYVAGQLDDAIAIFGRQQGGDANPGQLTFAGMVEDETGQGFTELRGVSGLAVSPDVPSETVAGAHLYAASGTSDNVTVFARDAATGDLTFVEMKKDGVGGVDGLDGAVSVILSPDGAHVYVAGTADRALGVFTRNADEASPGYGRLTFRQVLKDEVVPPGATDPVDGLAGVSGVAISPDGAHVYAAAQLDAAVATFTRDADDLSPDFGKLTFVEVLKDWTPGIDGLAGARSVAISSDGKHVYVAGQYDNALAIFTRNDDSLSPDFGRLTYVDHLNDGGGVCSATFAYCLGDTDCPGGETCGNADAPIDGLAAASAVVVDPQGKFVYVSGFQDDAVSAFERDETTGLLTYIETRDSRTDEVLGITRPTSIAVSPNGLDIYVTGSQDDAVAVFARDCAPDDAPVDTDGDGVFDACDRCTNDANKTHPGACGCGAADTDADADATIDCVDGCVDLDGDGYGTLGASCASGSSADCNDSAPGVHPDAMEVCNGVDDDCNVLIDDDALGEDTDADTVRNACDNCPTLANANQHDFDADSVGTACDNCPGVANADQADVDADGAGDVCDNCLSLPNADQSDQDADLLGDVCDNCAGVWNAGQSDADADGAGDACDTCTDTDGDAYGDDPAVYPASTCTPDNCPGVANTDQADLDADLFGDLCDLCPATPDDQSDSDADGLGDACDNCVMLFNDDQDDFDEDSVGDLCDNCPDVTNTDQADLDADLFGDACDNCAAIPNLDQTDIDGDNVGDVCDNCSSDPNHSQSNLDGDTEGDACDVDDGMIWISFQVPDIVEWDLETGWETWNLYYGDLQALRDGGAYTQNSQCNLTTPGAFEAGPLASGQVRFYLSTGYATGVGESGLGTDGAGVERPMASPCH